MITILTIFLLETDQEDHFKGDVTSVSAWSSELKILEMDSTRT